MVSMPILEHIELSLATDPLVPLSVDSEMIFWSWVGKAELGESWIRSDSQHASDDGRPIQVISI